MNMRPSLGLKILSVVGTLCLSGAMRVYAQAGVEMGDTVVMAISVETP